MKRIAVLLVLLFSLLVSCALAEETAAFLAAHPDGEILAGERCGDLAVAVMQGEAGKTLLVAEKRNGAWQIVVDNPNALEQDSPCPRLHVDSDNVFFWSYTQGQDHREYSAWKRGGAWGQVALRSLHSYDGGIWESLYGYDDGRLCIELLREDENENILSRERRMSIPGAWLEEGMLLEHFSLSELGLETMMHRGEAGQTILQRAAQTLLPSYAYVDGAWSESCLRFVLRRPDGRNVFVGVTEDEDGAYHIAESTPLPQHLLARIGYENFETALALYASDDTPVREAYVATLSPFADGTWGLSQAADFMSAVGPNWMESWTEQGSVRVFGDHPWRDIATIDFLTLPRTEAELAAGLDTSGWATPNNPNPADRLHLRTRPDRGAPSLGKYYNGAPVKVLGSAGEFTRVSVCGVEGYMMTKFLAFADEMKDVRWAANSYLLVGSSAPLYANTAGADEAIVTQGPTVIGVVGDEWFHVWFPETGESGYMRQQDLWPGNG